MLESITARTRPRFSVPRGLITGTLAAISLVWALYVIAGGSLLSAQVYTGIYLGLLLLTTFSRRAKVLIFQTLQRYTLNPLMRLLLAIGVNPLGLAILETRGHASGKIRRVPVGNGRKGDSFWIIASTAPGPATCTTSSTTRTSGSGCASGCATAGCPASPPCVPARTRWPASGRSSPGTHCAR